MVKLVDGQVIPESLGSHKKVLMVCDCGNTFSTQYGYFNSQHTKSCGHCLTFKIKQQLPTTKYGMLTFIGDINEIKSSKSCLFLY